MQDSISGRVPATREHGGGGVLNWRSPRAWAGHS